MKVATRIEFKISNSFPEWAKAFDDDRSNQEAAGITAIFRGVSETDSSSVMVILEAEQGALGKYMEGNKEIEASGHIIGSEEFSNWIA